MTKRRKAMKAALYARYSSENQKESSITDQFRNCEERAMREGWTVTARYTRIKRSTAPPPSGLAISRCSRKMLTDAKMKQFD